MVLEKLKSRVKGGLEKVERFQTKLESFVKKHPGIKTEPAKIAKKILARGGKNGPAEIRAASRTAARAVTHNTETHTKLPNATRKTKAKSSAGSGYTFEPTGNPLASTLPKTKGKAKKASKKEKSIYIGGMRVR